MKNIKALLFDQDGVIVDTERFGHRVAFNKTFASHGLDINWDEDEYHQLLQVGGGKERIRHYFIREGLFQERSGKELELFIKQLHTEKTEELISMIIKKELPLRPGIHRLMKEANGAGIPVAICTTSDEKNAQTILRTLLPDIEITHILAGDCVSKKKPDPEIYLKALGLLDITGDQGIVIEDSFIGTKAAKSAGLNVVATVNGYTKK